MNKAPRSYQTDRTFLRLSKDGRFLNLPVVEEDGTLVGCVDVLKLTYATLEQVRCGRLARKCCISPTDYLACRSLPLEPSKAAMPLAGLCGADSSPPSPEPRTMAIPSL